MTGDTAPAIDDLEACRAATVRRIPSRRAGPAGGRSSSGRERHEGGDHSALVRRLTGR